MPSDTPLGVLAAVGEHWSLWLEGNHPQYGAWRGIARYPLDTTRRGLHGIARNAGLRQLWIHPNLTAANQLSLGDAQLTERQLAWDSHKWPDGTWTTVARPALDPQDVPFTKAADGAALLAALVAFRDSVGMPWQKAPVPTALDLLRPTLRRQGAYSVVTTWPPCAAYAVESPLFWERDLSAAECHAGYVHVLDKHAAYLGVCGGLELGKGQPRHWPTGTEYHPEIPGYWRVQAPTWEDPDLPDPLDRIGALQRDRDKLTGGRWVSTPTLELALEAGVPVTILEAWTWAAHGRVLRPFYETMLSARRTLSAAQNGASAPEWLSGKGVAEKTADGAPVQRGGHPGAAGIALAAAKLVYAATLGGALAMDRYRALPAAQRPEWYRPDWRHAVIAKARANMWRSLVKCDLAAAGVVRVLNDAFYVVSDNPDALAVAAELGLPTDASLAGFSHKGTYRVADVLENRRVSLRRMAQVDRAAELVAA